MASPDEQRMAAALPNLGRLAVLAAISTAVDVPIFGGVGWKWDAEGNTTAAILMVVMGGHEMRYELSGPAVHPPPGG